VTGRNDAMLFSRAGVGGMGEPSHFEIGVPDSRRAQVFYGTLLGWTFNEGGRNSAAIETAGVPGGVHEAPEPGLVVFFSVPDLDAAVRRVRELGGEVDPRRSEGPAGKYASSCRDDQGVPFGLHQPAAG
jgi:predicted enzyme related to lactoylglutathione lyase